MVQIHLRMSLCKSLEGADKRCVLSNLSSQACPYLHFNQETFLIHAMIRTGHTPKWRKENLQTLHEDGHQKKAWTSSVPILLTPKMLSAIELLVSKRQACGVPKHNKYIFVRPGAMTSEAVRLLHVPGHWHRPTQACGDLVTSAQFDKHRNGPVG